MVSTSDASDYHWSAGDIVGSIVCLGLAVGLIILVIGKKSSCCIMCYTFKDRRRCNSRKKNCENSRKSKLQQPKSEECDLEAGSASQSDLLSEGDVQKPSEEQILPTHHGHSRSILMTESTIGSYQNDDESWIPKQPAMAFLKKNSAMRDDQGFRTLRFT